MATRTLKVFKIKGCSWASFTLLKTILATLPTTPLDGSAIKKGWLHASEVLAEARSVGISKETGLFSFGKLRGESDKEREWTDAALEEDLAAAEKQRRRIHNLYQDWPSDWKTWQTPTFCGFWLFVYVEQLMCGLQLCLEHLIFLTNHPCLWRWMMGFQWFSSPPKKWIPRVLRTWRAICESIAGSWLPRELFAFGRCLMFSFFIVLVFCLQNLFGL